jgi:hypothetical protein
LPGLDHAGIPHLVDVEFCARFPWRGGTHPWLDAVVQTGTRLIGVESKRFEPFRDAKAVNLSPAYDRDVWGPDMKRFERLRDDLRSGTTRFTYLDAAQLVKHAFGLVTAARRRKLRPVLFYLLAESEFRAGKAIEPSAISAHRREVAEFAEAIAGDEVEFSSSSYRDWLLSWPTDELNLNNHRDAVLERFAP